MFKLPPGDSTAPVQVTYKGGIIDHEQFWYFDHSVTFKVSFHNKYVDGFVKVMVAMLVGASRIFARGGGARKVLLQRQKNK